MNQQTRSEPNENNSDAKTKDDYAEAVKISGDLMKSCDDMNDSAISSWVRGDFIGLVIGILLSTKYPWMLLVVAVNIISLIAYTHAAGVTKKRCLEQHDLAGARKALNTARVYFVIVMVTLGFPWLMALNVLLKIVSAFKSI